ncbi:hypothetical protein AABB24_021461, partial [Solanum stoloniferum]
IIVFVDTRGGEDGRRKGFIPKQSMALLHLRGSASHCPSVYRLRHSLCPFHTKYILHPPSHSSGPRRFLYRQTLGCLQSEEAKFIKAEKNVKEFGLSVGLMKKESKKLLERASLAEKDMKRGHSDLMVAGNQIQSVAKSVYKVEGQAADLMDVLREIPGREALKLRAEVASMVSHLHQQRTAIDKRIVKISELGVPI